MTKIRIGILCGGRSAEHQVSLQSARNIIDAIDPARYEVVLIGIDRKGQWHLGDPKDFVRHVDDPKLISLNCHSETVGLIPGLVSDQLIAEKSDQARTATPRQQTEVCPCGGWLGREG